MRTLRRFIIISSVIANLLSPVAALGIATHDHYAIHNDTSWYDPNDGCGSSAGPVGTTGSTSGSDNEEKIWNWLVGQGLTGAQAAGVMGNIEQESSFDPTIIQGGGNSNDPNAAGSGGWGLFQWTPGGKVLQDKSGAGASGPIYTIGSELQIAWWEAQGNGLWSGQGNTVAKVKAVSGNDNAAAEKVADIWVNDFEHAGIIGPRGAYADQILALAKKKNWPNANATSSTGGSGGSTGGSTGGSSSDCCPSSTSVNGTFISLQGNDAISGTFVLGFDAGTPKSTIEKVFKKYKPAGIYILGTTNAGAAGFDTQFFNALAVDAGHEIIASSDEEGLYTRYKYNFNFPSAGQMSSMSDSQVQAIGKKVAEAMATNGLNTDLAPVLDVGTGNNSDFHQQPGRTFGTDPGTVTAKAGAFAAGLAAGGIKPTYKHFPGLGSSTGNTDTQSVTSPSLTQLESRDLVPYEKLANQNGAAVMMDNAHIPGLTGGSVASTSAAAISLLRNKYSFGGLVMTDDLIAAGVGLSPADALAQALAAGADAPLEKYTSDGVLDAAIAKAKALKVNTQNALTLLDGFVPNPGANQAGATCPGTGPTTCAGQLTNPFPGGWIPNRLDEGYDGTFKNKIVAPFDGVIQFSGMTQGWQGSYMVVLKAPCNVGLPNSQSLYFTEGVKPLVPNNGETVKAGTPIAEAYPSPYGNAYATTPNGLGQIEWGVADDKAPMKQQPNVEAQILGINGRCAPSPASKSMDLAFYNWAKKAGVTGNTSDSHCAGAP